MKFKRIMLIMLLLLAVLTIASVSATDNLTDADGEVLQQTSSSVVELDENSASQDELIGDAGTFSTLKDKIENAEAGATVNLENNYSFSESQTISISKELTINGNGYTIDANSQSSVFILNAKVTLENITFMNCLDRYGGTIAIDGSASDCKIISCNFIGCKGLTEYGVYKKDNWGAAIYNLGANTDIESCKFINCSTYNGGAIYASASNCNIKSCIFDGCYAENQGGAILSDVESTIDSCNFIRCSSPNKGGAIFNAGTTCNINSCNFTNCSAYNGNAIHNQKGNTNVKNSNFVDLAKSEVYARESGSVDFSDCTFNDPVPQYKYEIRVYDDSFIFKSNNPDYYPAQVAYVIVPPTVSEGKVVVSDGAKTLFSSPITDTYYWDDYGSEKACNIFINYLIFNGVNNDDVVRFAFLDGNDAEVIYNDYFVCFNGDYVKFEEYNDSAEKIDSGLTINVEDIDYGSDVVVVVTTNATFSGEVSVQIENGIYPVAVTNGYGNKNISNINAGKHTANAIFKATRLFKDSNVETNFTVNKIDSSVTVGDVEMDYGTSLNVEVTTVGATGFTAKIDGIDAFVKNNSVVISGLDVGNHTLSVTTNPDLNHNPVTKNATITVKAAAVEKIPSVIDVSDVVMDYGKSVNVTVATVGATGFTAMIDGKEVLVVGDVVVVSGLDVGNHTLTITTTVDSAHISVTKTVTITVNPVSSNKTNSLIFVDDVVVDYGKSVDVDVVTIGATGFTAKIDGKDAVVKDNVVVVSGLDVGNHTLTITTTVDSAHISVTKTVTITVKPLPADKLATSLSASKVTTTYGTSKNIVVTLKDKNNAPLANQKVTVTLNGKPYGGKTNDKGQASIAVPKNLAVKTYNATISFAGDDKYEKSAGSVNVVVNKANPKLTAKAISIKKSDKTKKYTVTLKTDKNAIMKSAKITITVNKKTYTAKTNAKGVATFKLTKLTKKGKYSATVKFVGDKCYNAKTVKNVKITIK